MSAFDDGAVEAAYQQLLAGRTARAGGVVSMRGEFCKRCRKSMTVNGLCQRCARLDIADGLRWLADEHVNGRMPIEDLNAGMGTPTWGCRVWRHPNPEELDTAIGRAKHAIAQRHAWVAERAAEKAEYEQSHSIVCLICGMRCKTERGLASHVAKSAIHARHIRKATT